MSQLGDYIARLIESRGLSYQEVAERAGLTADYMRQVTAGRVKVLDPPRRRSIARALRVTSLDLLIAAGQLNDKDLEEAEKAGILRSTTPPDVEDLIRTLRQIPLTKERVYLIRRYLENWIEVDEAMAREASETTSQED